jgi:hypothetical protein
MSQVKYLSQDIDFLDTLRTLLRGLQGFDTMALELIQNADDAKAKSIEFDFQKNALVVKNSSLFSDCRSISEYRCPWREDSSRGYSCDFHRLRKILSGDKRHQSDTTGSFGLGFISVLAYTDRPEVISGQHHWTICPDVEVERRIEDRPANTSDTIIRIPWAFDEGSTLRRELQLSAVKPDHIESFISDVVKLVPYVLLFLRHIDYLTVRQEGKVLYKVSRERVSPREVIIHINKTKNQWRIYEGDFQKTSVQLREKWNKETELIEPKRMPKVQIAIKQSPAESDNGLLFAFLPTETVSGFTFHINADFYLNPERRRVRFDGSYEYEWNLSAMNCAAEVVAQSLEDIGHSLGHVILFKLLETLEKRKTDPLFKAFWQKAKEGIENRSLIYTEKSFWAKPTETVLLRDESEYDKALEILHTLEIRVVNRELRQFYGLLRSIGVGELDADHLYQKLELVKVAEGLAISDAPAYLRDVDNRFALYDEISRLHSRKLNDLRDTDKKKALRHRLMALPIGVDIDGKIRKLHNMRRCDEQTREVFEFATPHVIFADTQGRLTQECEVTRVIPPLDVEAALATLETITRDDSELIMKIWVEKPGWLSLLHLWFAKRIREFDEDNLLGTRYVALSIFLAKEGFKPLNQLSLPSPGFNDPFKLDIAVDTEGIDEQVIAFWKALGIPQLDLATYVKRHLAPFIESQKLLDRDKVEIVINQLAVNMGQYQNDQEAMNILSQCPLVYCEDDQYHPPKKVYFPNEQIKSILGSGFPYMRVSQEGLTKVLESFYRAVGVTDLPRTEDIATRVKAISEKSPTVRSKSAIEKIFFYLSDRWDVISPRDKNPLVFLKSMAWLPEQGDTTAWHKPSELYTQGQAYLFQSQGHFLDFKREPTTTFREFLGLHATPAVQQVVNHLLWSAQNGKDVNPEIYRFLQRALNTDKEQVLRLQAQECINVGQGKYFRPDVFFWMDHPFGRWRLRLSENLREYSVLFKALGVRDTPTPEDYVKVILDISREFGSSNRPLDNEALEVIQSCYTYLSRALENVSMDISILEPLRGNKSVPNKSQRILYLPERIYFEDKTGYLNRFDGRLDHFVIPKERDTWKALQAIGVRPLSRNIKRKMIKCEGAEYNAELTLLIRERLPSMRRIIERQKASEPEGWNIDVLDHIEVHTANELVERLIHSVLNMQSEPIAVRTFYDSETDRLYVIWEEQSKSLLDMAKEIASFLNQEVDTCNIVPLLKDVLIAESPQAAECYLLEIGYEDIRESQIVQATSGAAIVEQIGGEQAQFSPQETKEWTKEVSEEVKSTCLSGDETNETLGIGTGFEYDRAKDAAKRKPPAAKVYSRLRSYVRTEDEVRRKKEEDKEKLADEESEKVERIGMEVVVDHEKAKAEVIEIRDVHDKGKTGEVIFYKRRDDRTGSESKGTELKEDIGYDLEVYERHVIAGLEEENAIKVRYIEVKAISSAWSCEDVGLTRNEFAAAQKLGTEYYLYIVDRALESGPHSPYVVRNPAGKVAEYRFDYGWKDAGILDSP